jgi:Zn/Cd-binding protein ZinT
MVHNIQQEEKERVIKAVKEWLKDNICERELEDWNGQWVNYYDICVTKYDKEEEFLDAFDEFVKTL